MNIFLEIFLYFDVFAIGVVSAVAFRHGHAHLRQQPQPKAEAANPPKKDALSQEIRDKLISESEQKYRAALDKSAEQLSKELGVTTEKIEESLKKLTTELITKELEGFNALFKSYEERAVKELEQAKAQTDDYQNQLKAKVEADAAAEKERLIELIDNKLADTIMSFLSESLQHEIDLGNQTKYLLGLLEQHKAEFKQAIE